ncbi:MAG: intradiol ring-cleavage dioxygenase, partial [Bacteroidota bacterium]
ADGCEPLPDTQVDVWQCDALGVYSDVRDPNFDTVGEKFLRGYQATDRDGVAHFTTIYPGWYPGRTVHIHFKIRTQSTDRRGFEFISQIYFDDALTDRAHAAAPYTQRGQRRRNQNDGIFRRGGSQLMLSPAATEDGYSAAFEIALHLP